MISEAIETILGLADPTKETIGGLEFTSKPVFPCKPPKASPLDVHSLAAVMDYLAKVNVVENAQSLFIHIVDPANVKILTCLNDWKDRTCLVYASTKFYADSFPFGERLSIEDFIIRLQATFVLSYLVDDILRVLGNVQAGKVRTAVDDGISQSVHTKAGATLLTEERLPTKLKLSPYRTFREVQQPASNFILRLHQNGEELPKVALYEADGSAWKLEAMENIKTYLAPSGATIIC